MKKTFLILFVVSLFVVGGCHNRRNIGTKGMDNDRGYTIDIPEQDFRYEKDFDDGNFEEIWEHIKTKDTEIKVTTYKNSDKETARRNFLRENDDYFFEDLTNYPLHGMEFDGDELWFNLYESNGNIYIVSWEYPGYADSALKTELSEIAGTFRLLENNS